MPHHRRIRYVDERLQKLFLFGLVALEAVLAGAMAWLMYHHLNQVIEDNMFRVHLSNVPSALELMMNKATLLLTVFSAVNLLALIVANLVWRAYVNSILRKLDHLMAKTLGLDFTIDPQNGDRHQVLELGEKQRNQERIRLMGIRGLAQQLAFASQPSSDPAELAKILQSMDTVVPAPNDSQVRY